MGTTLNRHAYQRLIDEDLEWLEKQPRSLEREHIKDIVRLSPNREYDQRCDLCHQPLAFCRCRTIGRITINRETETETFERTTELPSPARISPASAARVVDANEIVRQIRDKMVNGNPATLLADIAELVAPMRHEGESKCEHGIPWSMECLTCGPSDYVAVAATAAPQQSDIRPSCWHCGVVLAYAPKLRCEDCPDECDVEGCDELGCAPATPGAAPVEQSDELVDEVQRRMDQVVDAAVEWHQAGREGAEWFEAAEKLGAAIDSLLELRSATRTEI